MDKQILEQYIDACELIKDTKEEIRKLRKHRSQIQQDSVKGSAHEFPYTLQTYHLDVLGNAGLQSEETIALLAIENSKPHKDGLLFRICQYVEFKQRARRENEKL